MVRMDPDMLLTVHVGEPLLHMVDSRPFVVSLGAALAAALLLASAGGAATNVVKKKRTASRPTLMLAQPGLLGSFTPAASSPRMAAALARDGLDSSFRFTPSLTPGGRRAVTVAVRAQGMTSSGTHASPMVSATTFMPSAYSLGVAVGWRRFAISGDYARVASNLLPDSGHEAADVGLSYLGRKWRTTLLLGSERTTSQTKLFDTDQSYSVDLGGAYELTRNLAVSGGLRYQVHKDRLLNLSDDRRDSQAVYIGTALKF
jgi:hypothetical protein